VAIRTETGTGGETET